MDALLNLLGVENNQVLIRVYELIDINIEHLGLIHTDVGERIIGALFRKYPHEPADLNDFECFYILTLKENFIHLFEEPADNFTWLSIKQSRTYTIHFDLICNSFSFELHTIDGIIHFFEHNPKHDINLEKDENCLLVYKQIPRFISEGSKLYIYYNI